MFWALAEFPESESTGVWVGADEPSVIQWSSDREDWHRACSLPFPAGIGRVVEWPVVELFTGELRSRKSPLEGPLIWVCGEVLAPAKAELVGERQYRLGGLLRGLRGTPELDHAPGAEVMILDEQAVFLGVHRAMIGRDLWWRAVPDGENRGLTRPYAVQGLTCPPLDGSRPTVAGSHPEPPKRPSWGSRYLVTGSGRGEWAGWGGDIATWLDGWYREPVEVGTTVVDLETRERVTKWPEGWSV